MIDIADKNKVNFMKAVRKTLNPSVVEVERKAFFEASLKLLKAGKFQLVSMEEIAFHARISVMATPFIFESKENLFSALVENVTSQIEEVLTKELSRSGSFKEKFFELWLALYEFYSKQPGVISLVEQIMSLGQPDLSALIVNRLSNFLKTGKDELSSGFNTETIASVFHENVLTATKLKSSVVPELENLRLKLLPLLLWETYVCHECNGQGALYQ